VLVRGECSPQATHAASRPRSNLNGLVAILSAFFAAAQVFNLVARSRVAVLLFNVFLFVLLVNTLAFSPIVSVLRMAVITGAAFIPKFIVLGAISSPGEGRSSASVRASRRSHARHAHGAPSLAAGYLAFDAGAVSHRPRDAAHESAA
jgi:hypothetical protein